ncbi:hypothetical protein EVAR_96018_1 [Eumeta japonica]|uniref:Uncharacterized protein n=1 Tax=Eumeta variegata TaxID=151549 RepID=A0A4C1XH43_EUMVA|nr:hypothetical protein EVAR_96018_1 [Eumeta japonica]
MDEIMKTLKRMKVGKAAGFNRVSSEMLKGGGGIGANLLYQLFNKCWKSHRVISGYERKKKKNRKKKKEIKEKKERKKGEERKKMKERRRKKERFIR